MILAASQVRYHLSLVSYTLQRLHVPRSFSFAGGADLETRLLLLVLKRQNKWTNVEALRRKNVVDDKKENLSIQLFWSENPKLVIVFKVNHFPTKFKWQEYQQCSHIFLQRVRKWFVMISLFTDTYKLPIPGC